MELGSNNSEAVRGQKCMSQATRVSERAPGARSLPDAHSDAALRRQERSAGTRSDCRQQQLQEEGPAHAASHVQW